ncbi:MAG: hypothetical protein WCA35_03835 [Kovacikia sp.]
MSWSIASARPPPTSLERNPGYRRPNHSVISWEHINLLGEYDFSDEKLQDSVGIPPPKTILKSQAQKGERKPA